MTGLRRLGFVALAVALLHVIFGAIVRISGSGMGCGDHWPKCYGAWFPPLDQPTMVIEWTHRLLAAVLITTVTALAVTAWAARERPGVGGRGGVLRAAALAATLVVVTALFGALTVKLGNAPPATVGHWLLAATLVATLAAAVVRAGGLGGASARAQATSPRMARGATVAAALALLAVTFGGLTAKVPLANVSCLGFPHCREVTASGAPLYVQLTHRALAFVLVAQLLALALTAARRGEAPVVVRAARVALGVGLAQLVVAALMVELRLPPQLRSLHQAVGVGLWVTVFTLAYLARIAARTADARVTAREPARSFGEPYAAPRGAES